MTRQLEQRQEERQARRNRRIVSAVEYELRESISVRGREYLGFTARDGLVDCLLVLKAMTEEGKEVCFVGSDDLGSALMKAVRAATADQLKWVPDQYST